MPWHSLAALGRIIQVAVTTAVIIYPLVFQGDKFFKVRVFKVNGRSMHPCLNPYSSKCDDWVYVKDIEECEIYRGDVVTFIPPKDSSALFIKRVIGLEGDTVVKSNGASTSLITVPLGHYWVEGDNKGLSIDSQQFGPIPKSLLQSKYKDNINMRAVCFVNRLEFEFGGNVFRSSLTLGDVDNTGEMALVAGNASGDLAVFKGDKQWQLISGLGMITAVGVGDILNCGFNAVVVVCGDGWCYIYLCPPGSAKLECVHVQRIPANTKVLLLGDIDDDGQQELVLGLTDRVVRSYRWCWVGAPMVKETILAFAKTSVGALAGRGALVCLNKWEFAHQLGAVTLSHQAGGKPSLLVAQPGGTFMRIRCYADSDRTEVNDLEDGSRSNPFGETSVDYHPLCLNSMRNPNVSTEILGDIETGRKDDNGSPFAVATLDGTLMLVHNDDILWSFQVDHQLFAVTKLDITGDGHDEIVVCSWDGQTYILDLEKHSVRFQLEETVSGFCSGKYTMEPSSSKPSIPVLVYATFNNKIYIYYDIHLPSMLTENFSPYLENFMRGFDLQELAKNIPKSSEQYKYIAELLSGPMSREKIKKLTELCLYYRPGISQASALKPIDG